MAVVSCITGNLSRPSRTRLLAESLAGRLADAIGGRLESFDMLDLQPQLGTTIWRSEAQGRLDEALRAIEVCDFLVVGSPVYKASYTGLLKHLFDLLDRQVLCARPVFLLATGEAPSHGPLVEHGMRALFDFFSARVMGDFLYATDADFDGNRPGWRAESVLNANLRLADLAWRG